MDEILSVCRICSYILRFMSSYIFASGLLLQYMFISSLTVFKICLRSFNSADKIQTNTEIITVNPYIKIEQIKCLTCISIYAYLAHQYPVNNV